AACKEHADGFGVGYIEQHDCATRRRNDFRRRNTPSLRITNWRKLVHQSSEKNIFERTAKIELFTNLVRSKMF
ncbi:MAG: hypothetical protein LBS21_16110, partial [Clostridiales bacterium]|nr:hypothetical protein [Clostridiales bacterium]